MNAKEFIESLTPEALSVFTAIRDELMASNQVEMGKIGAELTASKQAATDADTASNATISRLTRERDDLAAQLQARIDGQVALATDFAEKVKTAADAIAALQPALVTALQPATDKAETERQKAIADAEATLAKLKGV